MSQVSKYFRGFENDSSDPDHTEVIWNNPVLSHYGSLFLILSLPPIKEQLEGLRGSTQEQTGDFLPVLDEGLRPQREVHCHRSQLPEELGREERRDWDWDMNPAQPL